MTLEHELPVLSVDAAIAFMGSPELFLEIAEMLVDEIAEQMELVRIHAAGGDLSELSRTAHRLKGNFGIVSADQAHAVAKELEHVARAGDAARSETAVAALETAVELLVPALEAHIASNSSK